MIDKEGNAKIADFGIMTDLELTLAKTQCGTAYYMAPEVTLGTGYTKSVDVWSLCATFYHLFKGVPPYYNSDVRSELQMLMRKQNPFLYEYLTHKECRVPVFCEIINHNLKSLGDDRFTISEIVKSFENVNIKDFRDIPIVIFQTEKDEHGNEEAHPTYMDEDKEMLESEVDFTNFIKSKTKELEQKEKEVEEKNNNPFVMDSMVDTKEQDRQNLVLLAVDDSLFDSEEQRSKLKKLRSQIFGKDPLELELEEDKEGGQEGEEKDVDAVEKQYLKKESLKELYEEPIGAFKLDSSDNEKDQIQTPMKAKKDLLEEFDDDEHYENDFECAHELKTIATLLDEYDEDHNNSNDDDD